MKKKLREIQAILSKYGHSAQADVVARIADLDQNDRRTFVDSIQGPEMWGGAGAVWEVALESPNVPGLEINDDTHRFRLALIEVAKAMDRQGIGTERSRDIAATIRGWVTMQMSGRLLPYTRPPSPPD